MQKVLVLLHAVVLSAALAAFIPTPASAAQKHELNFTTPVFDRHPPIFDVVKPWMKELEKASGGELVIHYFAPNTICPESEIFDATAQGGIEMGGNNFDRATGRLVLSELARLPMQGGDPKAAAMAWWDVCEEYKEFFPEFDGKIKLLFVWATAPVQINTTKKPVRALEDVKGLKLIGWSQEMLEFIKLLGGVPMFQSRADTFFSLERGMADGAVCPATPLRAGGYHTMADLSMSFYWCGINQQVFDALPQHLRALLEKDTGREFSGMAAQSVANGAAKSLEAIKKQGKAELIYLDADERARWLEAVRPMTEQAMKKIVASGLPEEKAREILDYYRERLARYSDTGR